jgi:hypothetical protein
MNVAPPCRSRRSKKDLHDFRINAMLSLATLRGVPIPTAISDHASARALSIEEQQRSHPEGGFAIQLALADAC